MRGDAFKASSRDCVTSASLVVPAAARHRAEPARPPLRAGLRRSRLLLGLRLARLLERRRAVKIIPADDDEDREPDRKIEILVVVVLRHDCET